jgi:flagellar basal-body rod protein FlgF
MLYGFGLSGTGAQIERSRLENLSNNLANIETPGFKEDLLTVMHRPVESRTWLSPEQAERAAYQNPLLDEIGGGVWLHQTHTDFSPGPMQNTGGDYDLALRGPGFFKVEEIGSGKTFLTRAGRFDINPATGDLVTPDGRHRVLAADNTPLNIGGLLESNGGERAIIAERGEVFVQVGDRTIDTGVAVGIHMLEEPDLAGLMKVGNNMFDFGHYPGGEPPVPVLLADLPDDDRRKMISGVRQGFVEGSGANPVSLMKQMIEVSRAYEMNMNMLQSQNGTVRTLIQGVGRAI